MKKLFGTLTIILALQLIALAQAPVIKKADPEPIADNSFLIEEGYNQEAGVVQHINTFMRTRNGDWIHTFTQEWPVRSIKHQVSFTMPEQRLDGVRGHGDMAINYRYQLVGNGETKLAISPRISLLVSTGDAKRGLGAGGVGIQTNLPISYRVSRSFVTHWNAGATFTGHAMNAAGDKATTTGFNLGQSTIWLAKPRFNVLVETAWNRYQPVIGPRQTENSYSFYVNPGIRWAYNLKNGMQIVPGIAVPIGIGPSRGEHGIFLYLSFEHAFKHSVKKD